VLPFRGSWAIARGEVTPGELRGKRYVRLFPDVYVDARAELDLMTRSLAAYLLVGRAGGMLAGYSAALLLGSDCAPANAPAEVAVRDHMRRHPGLRAFRARVSPADRWCVGGCLVTSPERTAWDLARRLGLVEAVVAVDALGHGRFDPEALLGRRVREPGARGCRRLDRVVELADPRAESPMETRLRLLIVLAGLPRPEVQYPLPEAGVRFDLAYPEPKLAIEYDGGDHDDLLDRRRDVRTGRLGWYTARFTKHDLAQPAATIAAVRALLNERRAGRERSPRMIEKR
jgi:very-short-patch-repair endonuclease